MDGPELRGINLAHMKVICANGLECYINEIHNLIERERWFGQSDFPVSRSSDLEAIWMSVRDGIQISSKDEILVTLWNIS